MPWVATNAAHRGRVNTERVMDIKETLEKVPFGWLRRALDSIYDDVIPGQYWCVHFYEDYFEISAMIQTEDGDDMYWYKYKSKYCLSGVKTGIAFTFNPKEFSNA